MASNLKRRNVAMGAKRKKLASSSDDEKDQSDTPNDDDEDNKPLFRFFPRTQALKKRQLRRRNFPK
jgi:hypothetical protein